MMNDQTPIEDQRGLPDHEVILDDVLTFDYASYQWPMPTESRYDRPQLSRLMVDCITRYSNTLDDDGDFRDLLMSFTDMTEREFITSKLWEFSADLAERGIWAARGKPSLLELRHAHIILNWLNDESNFHVEILTELLMAASLCPLHRCDWAICFDDENPQCEAIRMIYPHSHDT